MSREHDPSEVGEAAREAHPAPIPEAPAVGSEEELEDRPTGEPYSSPCSMTLDSEEAESGTDRGEPD